MWFVERIVFILIWESQLETNRKQKQTEICSNLNNFSKELRRDSTLNFFLRSKKEKKRRKIFSTSAVGLGISSSQSFDVLMINKLPLTYSSRFYILLWRRRSNKTFSCLIFVSMRSYRNFSSISKHQRLVCSAPMASKVMTSMNHVFTITKKKRFENFFFFTTTWRPRRIFIC